MSRQIWKFALPGFDCGIAMPKGATILDAQMQDENICVWAIVDPEETEQDVRQIRVVDTGHEMPGGDLQHIATAQDGPYVWHVFEVRYE